MDLLFSRYASPFLLLDELILSNNFADFVDTLLDAREDELNWQYYLSRVYDISFVEFKERLKQKERPSDKDIETTIIESMQMTMNFVPE